MLRLVLAALAVLLMSACNDDDNKCTGGACSSSSSEPTLCTTQYDPVCGYIGRSVQTYSNACVLKNAGASYLHMGECTSSDESLATLQECPMTYEPVCVSVQVECVTTPCDPVPETYVNRCAADANDRTTWLFDGECQSEVPAGCLSWYDGCNWCSRESGSALAACTLRYCYLYDAPFSCTEYENNTPPPIPAECKVWYDGCNTCTADENGTNLGCTEMACETYAAPRCLELL